ncbi:MAG: Mur ligase domain-containing protein, partial [Prochlorococcaceae cyanobacterium]
MPLDLQQVQRLWGEPLTPWAAEARGSLSAVSTDSRNLPAGALFVALVGERFDGHAFLEQALMAGSRALLAQRNRLDGAA